MIKVPVMDLGLDKIHNETETATKYILTNTELIPVEPSNQVLPQTVWVHELGKQLLRAASEGDVDEIRSLMSKGAPFTADWLGTSPLHLAAQNNHLEICLILLRAGISKDARTKVDRTPLHMAAYEGHVEIVECLLTHGADINCTDLLGMTPLHWAVQNGHSDVVSLLIRYGAHTHITNKFALSPLDIALQIQRNDIADSISAAKRNSLEASENLQVEMATVDTSNDSGLEPMNETQLSEHESPIPIETILLEDTDGEQADMQQHFNNINNKEGNETVVSDVDTNGTQEEIEHGTESQEIFDNGQDFSESFKLLQQHGITMLPTEETSIFTSVMNSGHQVVLTEVGKEILNSTKPVEQSTPVVTTVNKDQKSKSSLFPFKAKKIITVTPEEFLAMTADLNGKGALLQKVTDKFNLCGKPTVKRIVMKKNKVMPVSINNNSVKIRKSVNNLSDMEILMTQLIEARKQVEDYKKQIEEYKEKLQEKEVEAEKYKQQLQMLQQNCDGSS